MNGRDRGKEVGLYGERSFQTDRLPAEGHWIADCFGYGKFYFTRQAVPACQIGWMRIGSEVALHWALLPDSSQYAIRTRALLSILTQDAALIGE